MTNFFVLENLAMGANIAPTSYNSNPDKKAVVVDVYGDPPQSPVNVSGAGGASAPSSVTSAMSPEGQAVAAAMSSIATATANNSSNNGSVSNVVDRATSAAGISKGDISNARSGSVANTLMEGFGLVSNDLTKNVASYTNGVGGNPNIKDAAIGNQKIRVSIDGQESIVETKDYKALELLARMINNVSDNNELFQILRMSDTQIAIRVINQLTSEFGLPSVMEKILDRFTEEQQKEIILGCTLDIFAITNIPFLNKMIDVVGVKDLINANPYLIRDFIWNYRGDSVYKESLSSDTWDAINEVLTRLYQHWGYKYILGKEGVMVDLDLFKRATIFIKKCFTYNDKFSASISLMDDYRAEPFVVGAKRSYPWVSFRT